LCNFQFHGLQVIIYDENRRNTPKQVKNALGVEDDIVGADLRVRPNHPGVKDETMNSKRIQPASPSTEKFDRLKAILREMFQLDRGDLDFGLYRIMNLKAKEIEEFLECDLLPQVRTALEENTAGTQAELEKELAEAHGQAKNLGVDPETTQKVKELKRQLVEAKADLSAETDVYNHLTNFFARYYDEGDFMSLRRYSGGGQPTYLIPYDGEEVKLHWANADQYYVKTTENYSSYVFTVGMGAKTRRVRFEIAAADNEKDNVKEATGKQRRFLLAGENTEAVTFDGADLVVHFAHRPLTDREKKTFPGTGSKQQDRINEAIAKRILHTLQPDWQALLTASAPTEHDPERTVLDKHLAAYSAKNSFDYFIHKDLGGFLRRELDFYLKSEVLNLDDLALGDAARLDRALARMRAVRHVADKIIDFLAQLENFQKQLWLKKKFILDTQYCVTLDRVPETLYSEIAANESQHDEWVKLFAIDEITNENSPLPTAGDQGNGTPYTNPLTVDFLKATPYLVLDTRHFDEDFTNRLLAGLSKAGPLDEQMDGLLVHGENFQALNLLQARYQGQVNCIYIDPPYNTDASEILYKNGYKSSSWLSFLENRLEASKKFLVNNGILCITIDDFEFHRCKSLLEGVFSRETLLGVVAIKNNPSGRSTSKGFSSAHEYALFFGNNEDVTIGRLSHSEQQLSRYKFDDEQGAYEWVNFRKHGGQNANRQARPKLFYPIFVSEKDGVRFPQATWNNETNQWDLDEAPRSHETILYPVSPDGSEKTWKWGLGTARAMPEEFCVRRDQTKQLGVYRKSRLNEQGTLPLTVWDKSEYSSTEHGTNLLRRMFGESEKFSFPKSVHATADALRVSKSSENANVMDFFGGSGTTAHAVIELNRMDDGDRRFILVEMGDYFNEVTVPRVLKAAYSKEWKAGKPIDREGVSLLTKIIRLESYEDTLDSLEVTPPDSAQQDLLAQNPALAEDYRLRYALGVETSGSACLLGKDFTDPFAYTLSVVRDGTRREIPVDLPETFNYLLGLHVESRRLVDAVLTITGTDAEGKHSLILWRNLNETDNAVLEKWFARHRAKFVQSLDIIYTNGDHTLNALKQPKETWTAKTIEPIFRELMFKEVM